jgi:hypothetical protein
MRKICVLLFILMAIASPVFCKTSSFEELSSTSRDIDSAEMTIPLGQKGFSGFIENPFKGVFSFYNQMLAGVVAGALFGLKFAIELLNAVMNEDSNPKGVKRCITRLLIYLGFISFGSVGIFALLGVA